MVEVRDLTVSYKVKGGTLNAVDGVSLAVRKGETVTVVGESGSGKTTLGMVVLRLINPTSGQVFFKGEDITRLGEGELKRFRGRMQLIPQDPYSSMNPRLRVGEIVSEPLLGREDREKVKEALNSVGLDWAVVDRYPHELSGGQRQRALIARALVSDPEFLVLDEPTSNLDVSIQAQILNLLLDLQSSRNLTYLFITHNMAVAKYVSDRVAVMYRGRLVEIGDAKEVMSNPLHPYTKALFDAVPEGDFRAKLRELEVRDEGRQKGCRYSDRCKFVRDQCRLREPDLLKVKENHEVACILY
jgi:oligopeptide/dipeptide ABC transporter, ATP-binding protein, C-terminal domain